MLQFKFKAESINTSSEPFGVFMSSFVEKFSDIISDTYNYFSHSLWRQPIVAPAGPVLLLWLVVFALSGIFLAGKNLHCLGLPESI